MAFSKITNTELNSRGATTLPNQPTISATALKQEFDAPAKNIVAPKFNQLIDDLGAGTAADDVGAVAPTGRTGTTIQGVLNSISSDLADTEAEKHTHTNKTLLDDYTQTETDLADAVTKKHDHTNKTLLDTYTQADSDLSDAVSKKHDHSNKSLLDTYTQTEADIADAVSKKHSHSNKSVLDDVSDSGGKLAYKGSTLANNAYKSVKVTSGGSSTTIDASGEDSFELYAGANVTMSVDTTVTPKKITVNSSGGGGGGSSYTAGNGIDISGTTIAVDFGTVASATTTKPPTGKAVYDAIDDAVDDIKVGDLKDTTLTSVADGDLLTAEVVGGVTTWKNKAPDKSLARYGGSKTFSELTSTLLIADNEDKFFLCTDGGTIASADAANWILPAGSVIPADSHIAVVNTGTALSPVYQFDDFGGYIDISGKADKTELDSWAGGTYQQVSGGEVTFSNIDDTDDNGYILMCERKNVSSVIKTVTNDKTSSMSITFTVTGAQNGDKCKLRILK